MTVLNKYIKGTSQNYVDNQGENGGLLNINGTSYAYVCNQFVNEGGAESKILKILSTWFIDDP